MPLPARLIRAPGWRSAAALAAALCAAAAAPGAAHAAGFAPPVDVSVPAGASIPESDIAVNAAGETVAVWIESGALKTSFRPPGGAFSTPQTVGGFSGTPSHPRVGIDDAGNRFLAVDVLPAASQHETWAASAAPGQDFGAAQMLQAFVGGTGPVGNTGPEIAVAPGGDAVVVWVADNSNTDFVRYSIRPAGGGFSAAQTIAGTVFPSAARVDIGANGTAIVVWKQISTFNELRFATRAPGGASFGSQSPAISASSITDPDVAVNGAGGAIAGWQEAGNIRFATIAPGATSFSPNPTVVASGRQSGPDVDTDDAGATRIAYATAGGTFAGLRPAGAAAADNFAVGQLDAAPAGPGLLELATGAGGDSLAAWQPSSQSSVLASFVQGTGALGPGVPVGQSGLRMRPQAAIRGVDGAVSYVESRGAPNDVLVVRGYDSTPPQPTGGAAPTTGTAGEALAFSATASDLWGPVTASWDFGDGSTATGMAVSHAYAAAGNFTWTLTLTDGAGNAATVTGQVAVAAAPLLPERGETVLAGPVSGVVKVAVPTAASGRVSAAANIPRPPRYTRFRRLRRTELLPVRAIIDARRGTVRMGSAVNSSGPQIQSMNFRAGGFMVKQQRKSPLTTMVMRGGGNFKTGCRSRPGRQLFREDAAAARRRPRRRLFASGRGRFRTRGRNSTATVRGTVWLTKDSCAGTLTVVRRGSVRVHDLVKGRTVTVKAGRRYLARPRRR